MNVAPYGSWKSPITADLIVSETIGLGSPALDGGDIYWIEDRPGEGGRSVIVRHGADGTIQDVLPQPFAARSRVHEYGGGSYLVAGRTVWFSHFADQRVYRTDGPGSTPVPVTPPGPRRYADFCLDAGRGRLLAVCEDHGDGKGEPANRLVALPLDAGNGGDESVLVEGADFYGAPRLSPDGKRLAWFEWNHPNMPWDATVLKVADLDADGRPGPATVVAGGRDVSVVQPLWSPAGVLHFVDDRTGWWNLYRWNGGDVEPLMPMEAEFARPLWQLGQATYGFTGPNDLLAAYIADGRWYLTRFDGKSGTMTPVDLPVTEIGMVRTAPDGTAVLTAGGPTTPTAVIQLGSDGRDYAELRRSSTVAIPERYLSEAELVEFTGEGDHTAYGLFYRPANPEFEAPAGTLPPLLVKSHGGPTSAAGSALDLGIQFWTSRGFAVLDVNYRGSTGYGTAYRRALDGLWGVADVEDCAAGAAHLAALGAVDGDKLAIRGGSAGGYTTLCALTFTAQFKAGASYYGISDLKALADDTHKFESRYLDRLLGPPGEIETVMRERSPIHHLDRLSCPVIFFQGLEDRVVPPNQAERMVTALKQKGLPVAYLAFPGEMHGFRKAETIKRALEAELYFYGRIFGFQPADKISSVPIENWPN
jgi:dipeptidyl aminopeptidase/acylaminoacyl peptidase